MAEKKIIKGKEVLVSEFPKCDFCSETAYYDGMTIFGPWGYMCENHFRKFGVGLGVGRGQKLILRE